jgi:hypothetical protein
LALARSAANQEGWPFLEPISIVFRKRWFGSGGTWTVQTHINSTNGQVGIRIDDATRAILEKRFVNLPR